MAAFTQANSRKPALILFFMAIANFIIAQGLIKGRVVQSDNSQGLPGATITVKGTSQSTTTNANGQFSINASGSDVLVISYVGYQNIEVKASDAAIIQLAGDGKSLNEVVVTALGIRKETKRLGYSVQEVKGADLVKAREPNAINGLVGKVAGLSVGGSAEILGRPQVLLRGGQLSFFVVDGIPINSDTWNISPDDIESYTVLKGPTAAALYGNRAINGAIIINTKKGSKDKRGFSVEFNSSTMFENGFNAIPKVQDEYGPGDHGRYAFADGRGGGLNDGDYD
ncbi:MAG TPA: carboxypeptidase-like regulatory domain-containing protein, partial [Flavisolibacter sp.]|nr:carboxypeptidase-like regulatory domain-containing protein [Flavisolibacter sp.]